MHMSELVQRRYQFLNWFRRRIVQSGSNTLLSFAVKEITSIMAVAVKLLILQICFFNLICFCRLMLMPSVFSTLQKI